MSGDAIALSFTGGAKVVHRVASALEGCEILPTFGAWSMSIDLAPRDELGGGSVYLYDPNPAFLKLVRELVISAQPTLIREEFVAINTRIAESEVSSLVGIP